MPGKIEIAATKPLATQRDLALAYTPGVAAGVRSDRRESRRGRNLTARGNLVGVITNGTAVLGLGAIGPLAAKPVMEGKAVLFKKFAGIDVFDIEVNERDPEKLVDIIAALEPTFGGINLEDIKAPECFYVEKKLRERMKIPVFHDDQHGTAIIVGAAIVNGLKVVGKDIAKVKLVCSGAGAAALACLDMLVGARHEDVDNIWVTDIAGVVYAAARRRWTRTRSATRKTHRRARWRDVIDGADVFLGLSAGRRAEAGDGQAHGATAADLRAGQSRRPKSCPKNSRGARPDAVIATGRSDYPNQVNNVLCFPFIFRGALDVGATTINEAMKLAAVHAIAESGAGGAVGHRRHGLRRTDRWLRPRLPDSRNRSIRASSRRSRRRWRRRRWTSGVATVRSPIAMRTCSDSMQFVYHSGLIMKPVFEAAKEQPKRIVLCRGRRGAGSARGAGGGRRRAGASRSWSGGPRSSQQRIETLRAAHRDRAATSRWSIRNAIRAIATTGRNTTGSRSATRRLADLRQDRDAPPRSR